MHFMYEFYRIMEYKITGLKGALHPSYISTFNCGSILKTSSRRTI